MAAILAATYPDLFAALAVFAGAEFKAACTTSEGFAAMNEVARIRPGKGNLLSKSCAADSQKRKGDACQ